MAPYRGHLIKEMTMKESLDRVARFLKTQPELAGYEVRQDKGELHLSRGSDCFVRLIPEEKKGQWHIEHFHNQERWECLDFVGSLEECLDLLTENTHYLFWEG